MKKEFVSILLVASMICMSLTYAMEEQTKEEVRFGENFVYPWFVQGSKTFRKLMEAKPRPEFHLDNFTLLSSDGERLLKISPAGQLTVGRGQKCVVDRDESGKTTFDIVQRDKTGRILLDEEKKTMGLQIGSNVTWRLFPRLC